MTELIVISPGKICSAITLFEVLAQIFYASNLEKKDIIILSTMKSDVSQWQNFKCFMQTKNAESGQL